MPVNVTFQFIGRINDPPFLSNPVKGGDGCESFIVLERSWGHNG